MVYACIDCGFIFSRTGQTGECPSCGKERLRVAAGEEIQRLWKLLTRENRALRIGKELVL